MLSFLIIILCINIDALSFGISYGLRKQKIGFFINIFITTFSTLFFTIPLVTSKLIFSHLNNNICNLLNGIFLIILGLFYIFENNKKSHKNLTIKNSFIECFIISIDAIFSAIFNGYLINTYIFYIIFYYITNFFAIFLGNRISFKLSSISNINFSLFSGLIFIFLGIFKIFGF